MKVLFALGNYPQLSESYVEAEIEYALRSGVEVEVWSPPGRVGSGVPSRVRIHHGIFSAALRSSSFDIVHVYYLTFAKELVHECRVPMTIRAHSFDWSPELAVRLASSKTVRGVYAFPHFAREANHPKVIPLPVAYSSTLFPGEISGKDPLLVARLAAGRRMKGLSDFIRIATIIPDMKFILAVATTIEDDAYMATLRTEAVKSESPVEIVQSLPRREAVALTKLASVYIDTSDPAGHPFGMPVSVAEALSTGSFVLMRDSKAAREYGGNSVYYYPSIEEAALAILRFRELGDQARSEISANAVERSKFYRDDAVLPRLIDDWRKICTTR